MFRGCWSTTGPSRARSSFQLAIAYFGTLFIGTILWPSFTSVAVCVPKAVLLQRNPRETLLRRVIILVVGTVFPVCPSVPGRRGATAQISAVVYERYLKDARLPAVANLGFLVQLFLYRLCLTTGLYDVSFTILFSFLL